jgi:hypothetical protein
MKWVSKIAGVVFYLLIIISCNRNHNDMPDADLLGKIEVMYGVVQGIHHMPGSDDAYYQAMYIDHELKTMLSSDKMISGDKILEKYPLKGSDTEKSAVINRYRDSVSSDLKSWVNRNSP